MRRATTFAATAVTTTLVATLLTTTPAAVAKNPGPSLTIETNTGSYTGGSMLTFKGHLGVSGKKRIQVQRHMNRVNDSWGNMKNQDVTGWSNPDGSFEISAPASSMWEISYRVVSANGKHSTPVRTTYAKAQEAILTQESPARVGRSFDLRVDTLGADFTGYRDLPGVRLPGRTVTIQQRVNALTWTDVATGSVNSNGVAHFEVTAPSSTGNHTYRAKLHDWKQSGDDIGWTASYPIEVKVTRNSGGSFAPTAAATSTASTADDTVAVDDVAVAAAAKKNPVRKHAAERYQWGRNGFRYSFDWEFGQSLSSAPTKGKQRRGQWIEGSDGTGRVTMRNGGMLFSSDGYRNADGRNVPRSGVKGSVWATVKGNAHKRGRWEVRGLTTQLNGGSNNKYRVRYELVPNGTFGKCTPSGIVIAETTRPGKPVRFGVRNAKGTTWARKAKLPVTAGADSFAVQVTKKHITWFVNSKPVGTLRNKAALPKTKMALRVSMVDRNGKAMSSTKSTVDWVRAYPLKAGKKATTKKGLKKGAALPRC